MDKDGFDDLDRFPDSFIGYPEFEFCCACGELKPAIGHFNADNAPFCSMACMNDVRLMKTEHPNK